MPYTITMKFRRFASNISFCDIAKLSSAGMIVGPS